MTRFIHDQFAKQLLSELLSPLGQVETSKDVLAEVQQVDVLFLPSPNPTANSQFIGLLGRLVETTTLLEPFRNPVTKSDIRSCLGKLLALITSSERQANRANNRLNEADLPRLWILTPTASENLLQSFRASSEAENWSSGIYFLPEALRTGIIVIHQLPRTPESLWLRVFGRGRVQQQAIQELKELPIINPFREVALELVYDLLTVLETSQRTRRNLDEDDRGLIMQLSPIYLQRLEEARQQGQQQAQQQGRQQERRATIESLLQIRFGSIDGELELIIEPLMELEAAEFTPLLLQLSREELLTRLGN